jgi:hypothetical protein
MTYLHRLITSGSIIYYFIIIFSIRPLKGRLLLSRMSGGPSTDRRRARAPRAQQDTEGTGEWANAIGLIILLLNPSTSIKWVADLLGGLGIAGGEGALPTGARGDVSYRQPTGKEQQQVSYRLR